MKHAATVVLFLIASNAAIAQDPNDAATIYYGSQYVHKKWLLHNLVDLSIDGGKTFAPIRIGHGDTHDLWINPNNPSIMGLRGTIGGFQFVIGYPRSC